MPRKRNMNKKGNQQHQKEMTPPRQPPKQVTPPHQPPRRVTVLDVSAILLPRHLDDLTKSRNDSGHFVYTLRQLLPMVPTHYEYLLRAGAVEEVLLAMKYHKEGESLIVLSLRFLYELFDKDDNQVVEILEARNGIRAIVRGMYSHSQNKDIQHYGAALLLLLVCKDMMEPVAQEGGIGALIRAMSDVQLDDSFIQTLGWSVIAEGCADNVTPIVNEAGVVELAIVVLKRYASDVSFDATHILKLACTAIWSLAQKSQSTKAKFATLGGIGALVTAMDYHVDKHEFVFVALAGVRELCNTTRTVIKEQFVEEEIVDTLVTIMEEYSSCGVFVGLAVDIISCLALDCRPAAETIANECGFSAVVKAMSLHRGDVDLVKSCCHAIVAITSELGPSTVESLLTVTPHVLVTVVVASMNNYIRNEPLVVASCGALFVLLSKADMSHDPVRSRGVSAMIRAVNYFPLNRRILQYTCRTIGNQSTDDALLLFPMAASTFAFVLLRCLCRKGLSDDDDFELHAMKALHYVARHNDMAKQEVLDNGLALLIAIGMDCKNPASMEARRFLRALKEW